MKIEGQDFMEWLHRERNKIEEERAKSKLTITEWVNRELKKVQAKGFTIKEPKKV